MNCSHDLEYCLAPYDFAKRYGRWQVRCTKCGYKSRLIADKPPTLTPKEAPPVKEHKTHG